MLIQFLDQAQAPLWPDFNSAQKQARPNPARATDYLGVPSLVFSSQSPSPSPRETHCLASCSWASWGFRCLGTPYAILSPSRYSWGRPTLSPCSYGPNPSDWGHTSPTAHWGPIMTRARPPSFFQALMAWVGFRSRCSNNASQPPRWHSRETPCDGSPSWSSSPWEAPCRPAPYPISLS